MNRDQALRIASLTKHQYYHQPSTSRPRGRAQSTHTRKQEGEIELLVQDDIVIYQMRSIEADPDLSCGIKRMTAQLHLLGYKINRKKVARLMKENALTKPRRKAGKKQYVKYRIVTPLEPLTVLEMDIKQVWIVRDRRSAYILTVLDTFTREALAWMVGFTMTSREVKLLWDRVILNHLEPAGMASREIRIEIRNDGGPQFAAHTVQNYFRDNGLDQVFTHPYTPQENGHIESFHSILSSSIDNEYFGLEELENRLHRFYYMYNNERAHTGTKGLPPVLFNRAWNKDLVFTCYDGKKGLKIKLRKPIYEMPEIWNPREHLAKKERAQRTDSKKNGGACYHSAHYAETPVNPSPSVASCKTNENKKLM
jgi:putative transposase